jgi:hypothetical protein
MFTKLIATKKIHVNDADYEIRYYRKMNLNGGNDKIILDDHSIASLEYKVDLVLPAALYSRIAGNHH